MTKRGPLSKIEKSYIENNTDKDVAELAKDLQRSEQQVSKFLGQPKTKSTQLDNLIAKKVRNGEVVATVMTGGASQYLDDTRRERIAKKNKNDSAIHRPKG